jgi:hypothetical protein
LGSEIIKYGWRRQIMVEDTNVKLLSDEYMTLVKEAFTKSRVDDFEESIPELKQLLVCASKWSESAANELLNLAENYGAFILRNALALAIALDIQDGKLGL